MNKIAWATSLCLLFLAGMASAEEGLAVGASYGYANIDDSADGLSFDASDTGYKLFGSYTFRNGFGIEGGYIDFGEPDENILGQVARIDASGWDLYGVGTLGLSDGIDLFAKAGVVSWEADAVLNGIRIAQDDGEDLALGIGAKFGTGSLGLRAEFEWFDIADADAVWMASVGLEFRF